MDNYEYIIASLPEISPEKLLSDETPEEITEFILSQLEEKDIKLAELLFQGWDPDKLGEEFYNDALASKNRFIREYYEFDLAVRNAKVRHLNKALGRPEGTDIFMEKEVEPELQEQLDRVCSDTDILGKERALDRLYQEKIEEITTFDYFDADAIFGFLAKLHIVQRWMQLDEETGRAMFRELLQGVRSTFKGVEFTE